MTYFERFRQWIAEPVIARLREEHDREVYLQQQVAYSIGIAVGEVRGQQRLEAELRRIVESRDGFEITESDLNQVRKGMLH